MADSDRIHYMVGELYNPGAEPFMVVRGDLDEAKGGKMPVVVQSLHWTREDAQHECDLLSGKPGARQ